MILIIDCGSNKTRYIEETVDLYADCKTIPLLDFEEKDLLNISGVIISGAPLLITEVDTSPYLKRLSFILNTNIPIFGICFGHQLIGLLHGAHGSRIKEDRDWQTIDIYEDSDLFKKLPNEIQMMEDHCEVISIPPGFKLVASSDASINEAMEHHNKKIYGVQFHPEVSGNHGAVVIENFVNICKS